MGENLTDQELVERVQRGDKRAFDLLVIKYQNKIISLISRYIRDPAEVMDVAQESFIKAYRALPGFRGESAFYTWLYRIASNTAKNYLVTQNRRQNDVDIDDEGLTNSEMDLGLHESETPESLLIKDQVEQVVFDAIEHLPNELRTAIMLRELEGMSYEEIAQIMECPVGTVRSRIFRAREAIDAKLKAMLGK